MTTSGALAPQSLRGHFDSAAQRNGLDSGFLQAVGKQESDYNPKSISSAGAIGIMQLMPDTAKGLGVNPYDARQNIEGGAKFLADQLNKYGSYELALAAYNAGPGRLDRAIKSAGSSDWKKVSQYLPKETQNYVPKVMGYWRG